jgi:hypothetical protein
MDQTPIDKLNALIEEAQVIIKESRQNTVYKYMAEVEKFLAKSKIPVNYYYDEKDFYTYNAYPIINFIDLCNAYNAVVKPQIASICSESDLIYCENVQCKPFVYNFIHNSYFKRFELVKFFNLFFPNYNQKFTFETFESPARIDKSINIIYVHPKYILEEVLHQTCLIENADKMDELRDRIANILADIKRIDGKDLIPDSSNPNIFNNFNSTQVNLLSVISSLDVPIVRCFYDRQLPILITNDLGLSLIEYAFKGITANYERKDSTSKSFFDNRVDNVIFKIDGKQIVKVFPLLDYEIVPIKDDSISNIRSANMRHRMNKDQMNKDKSIFDCHTNIALRLAFNEYITYDIVGNQDISRVKLSLFASLYNKYGVRDMKVSESNVVGTYYPFEMYIKELRVMSIKKAAKRQNN